MCSLFQILILYISQVFLLFRVWVDASSTCENIFVHWLGNVDGFLFILKWKQFKKTDFLQPDSLKQSIVPQCLFSKFIGEVTVDSAELLNCRTKGGIPWEVFYNCANFHLREGEFPLSHSSSMSGLRDEVVV